MKLIGKTPAGNALVEIEQAWVDALRGALQTLHYAMAGNAPAAPVAIAPAGPVVRQKRPACSKAGSAQADKSKPCAVCGKTFKPKTSEVTCSGACREKRKAQQNAARCGKPALPNAVDKAARLALIRQLNNKLDAAPTPPDAFAPADPNED